MNKIVVAMGTVGLALLNCAAGEHPAARVIAREPMMKFADVSRKGEGAPFSKDPTVIRVKDR